MTAVPEGPFFVSQPRLEGGGVDYLGLRQVNLDYISQLWPGINNVTRHIRPYAVMCWVAWTFRRALQEKGIEGASVEDFAAFREKVEILFGWSHQLEGLGTGMVGNAQQVPPAVDGHVPLRFSDWNRKVSWLDAVNYGPSLKIDSGIGFLAQVAPGVFAPTHTGELLAKALDRRLSDRKGYERLCSITSFTGSLVFAKALLPAWHIEHPSAEERRIFLSAFLGNDKADDGRAVARAASSAMITDALASAARPLTEAELRRRLTFGRRLKVKHGPTLAHWRVLQVRQVQRFALELLLSWVEDQVLVGGARDSQALVSRAMEVFKKAGCSVDHASVGAEMTLAARAFDTPGANDPDLLVRLEALQAHARSKDWDAVLPVAVPTLIQCAALTEHLDQDPHAADQLDAGHSDRVSLKNWSRFVRNHANAGMQDFLLRLIENYIISQHFAVAALRLTDTDSRLRMAIEDEGLISLLGGRGDIGSPNLTGDRLATALSLLSECRVVVRTIDDDFYRYHVPA